MTTSTATTHDADARHLIELYDTKWAIVNVNARRAQEGNLTGRDIDAALEAGKRQDEACEAFRRKYYPRAGRVICALGMVSTVSPKGRALRCVFDARQDDGSDEWGDGRL